MTTDKFKKNKNISKQENRFQKRLLNLNINAIKVHETDEETADFFIDGDEKFLIEYKIRNDNTDLKKELFEKGYSAQCTKTASTNTVYKILKKAKNQLLSSGKNLNPEYFIIWFYLMTSDNEHSLDQIYRTVYGCQDLLIFGEDSTIIINYFYYNESFFFKYKEIVATVVEYENKFICYVNNFSQNSNDFCDSNLGVSLNNILFNPLNKNENILVADCNIDRKNKIEINEYLNSKYAIKIKCPIDLNHFHGRIS